MNVLGHGLEAFKVGDLLKGVTGLFQQRLVDDDAKGLVAVAHGQRLAVGAVEVELIGGQLFVEVGILQVEQVIGPSVQTGLIAALEQRGGRVALVHFGGEGFGIGAGGRGFNRDGHAGLLGVGLGQRLPGGVGFGLEVEVVDLAGGLGGGGARNHGQAQRERKNQGQQFLHKIVHSFFEYMRRVPLLNRGAWKSEAQSFAHHLTRVLYPDDTTCCRACQAV